MSRPAILAAATAAGLLMWPAPARAHRMLVTAAVRPDDPGRVRVAVGYESGDGSDGATVTLRDGAGRETARGVADVDGVCHLPRPAAGAYTVTADDGAGHREAIPLLVPASPAEAAEAASAARNRWGMGAVGLVVIACGTLLLRRVLRKPAGPGRPADGVVTRIAET